MQRIDMFRLPVYEFRNQNHFMYKDLWLDYIRQDNWFEADSLRFTNPNLHKLDLFNPLVNFMGESMASVLTDLGMMMDFGFTSVWGTYQTTNNKHHSHTHGNNLFAAVYYLHSDYTNDSGTVFENVVADFNPIKMMRTGHSSFDRADGTPVRTNSFQARHQTTFEEGKLIIFPASLRHYTKEFKGTARAIVGFNMMPIGKTSTDPFDRYFYQHWDGVEMHGDGVEKWTKGQ